MRLLKNMSLLKRLYISLTLFIFIPLIVVGLVAYFYVGALGRENSYADELKFFISSIEDIENELIITENIQTSTVVDFSVYSLLNGTGGNRDYVSVGNYFEELLMRYPLYQNITLSAGGDIVFQRGVHITGEIEEYINMLQVDDLQEHWAPPHKMNTADTNFENYTEEVITYYSKVVDIYHDINNSIGIMAININEQMLYDTYTTYVNQLSEYSAIVKSDGIILSSGDKSQLGQKSELYNIIQHDMTSTSGYILLQDTDIPGVCYYYIGEETQFTYINIVPLSAYGYIENSFALMLSIAIFAFLLFGLCFSTIQRLYIVNPILKIRNDLLKVEQGIFNLKPAYYSKDEIGQLAVSISQMSHSIDNLINENYLRKIKQQEAEMNALVMQINPHFLYNTLDSIQWLAVTEQAYDTSEQIVALSSIFRHALSKGDEFVTVQSELDFLENYMFIMKRRYGKRVELIVDVDDAAKQLYIPKLIIQPLIENSILHGIEPQKEGGTITVSIKLDDLLTIKVKDTGIGTDESTVKKVLNDKESTKAFALKNINERLRLLYGNRHVLCFSSKEHVGTEVTIALPRSTPDASQNEL